MVSNVKSSTNVVAGQSSDTAKEGISWGGSTCTTKCTACVGYRARPIPSARRRPSARRCISLLTILNQSDRRGLTRRVTSLDPSKAIMHALPGRQPARERAHSWLPGHRPHWARPREPVHPPVPHAFVGPAWGAAAVGGGACGCRPTLWTTPSHDGPMLAIRTSDWTAPMVVRDHGGVRGGGDPGGHERTR